MTRAPARALACERGFTLVELLIVMLLAGLVLGAALTSVQVGTRSSEIALGRTEAQANGRVALERLMADIRAAGYDPTVAGFDAVEAQTATSVILRSDLNASGTIDPPVGACDASTAAERVRYRLSGNLLLRSTDPNNAACEAPLIGGVTALTFTYLRADGTTAAAAPEVRSIRVSITVRPESVTGSQVGAMTVTMVDQARFRNR
jgi:prepilin-type N-terminal cleavage/methylation domain-containing protein